MTWDLHFHSTNSDGSKTPEERLKQIQSLDPNNTWFWALTDHDRFSEDFVGIAQDAWVRVVRGVEISAHSRDLNHSFHVLCYVPQISKKIAALIDRVIIGRTSRVEAQLVKLRANGFEIVDEDFFYWIESQKMSRESATNFHIAHYIRGHRENRELIKHLTNGVISSEHSDRETLKFMSECLRRNGDFNHIGYVEISAYEPEVTELVRIAEAEDLTLAVAHPNFSFNKKLSKQYSAHTEWQKLETFERVLVPRLAEIWLVNYEVNALANQAWIDVIRRTREKFGGIITFWSDNHGLDSFDSTHGIFGKQNPLLTEDDIRRTLSKLHSYL